MSLFSTPVCSVFIVCCLCTMVNCFQPKKKKKWQDSKYWEKGTKLCGIYHGGIYLWGWREGPRMFIWWPWCWSTSSHCSSVFFSSPWWEYQSFFFVSLGEFNMVKRECLWELVGVNSKLYHFFGVWSWDNLLTAHNLSIFKQESWHLLHKLLVKINNICEEQEYGLVLGKL